MVSVAVPAMLASKGVKKSGQIVEEKLGYNFVDLVQNLQFFM